MTGDLTASRTLSDAGTARSVRVFLVAYVVAFVAGAIWSIATPLFAAPDEPTQVVRAVSVARGDVLGLTVGNANSARTRVEVPGSYASGLRVPYCYHGNPHQTPVCAPPLSDQASLVGVNTYVGRYPPLYYAVVGLPSRFLSAPSGVRAMRLVSDAFSAVFLALAATVALVATRRRTMLLGLLLAVTPEVLFFSGVVNPSSLEMSSAICLWVAGLTLALDHAQAPPRALVAIVVVSACVEVLSRSLSPLWVGLTLVTVAALAGPTAIRQLLQDASVRIGVALLLAVTAGALVWTVAAHGLDVLVEHGAAAQAITGSYLSALVHREPLYLRETVGLFGWQDTTSPLFTYLVWALVTAATVVVALRVARWRGRLVLFGLIVACVVVPAAIVLSHAGVDHGLVWQGRDGAPLMLGVPIVACALASRDASRRRRTALATGIVLAMAAQVVSFAGMLDRYVAGTTHAFDFFAHPLWQPPIGARALFVAFALVALCVTAMAVRTLAARHGVSSPDEPHGVALEPDT